MPRTPVEYAVVLPRLQDDIPEFSNSHVRFRHEPSFSENVFFFLNTFRTLEAQHGITSNDRRADAQTLFSDTRALASFHRTSRPKSIASACSPRTANRASSKPLSKALSRAKSTLNPNSNNLRPTISTTISLSTTGLNLSSPLKNPNPSPTSKKTRPPRPRRSRRTTRPTSSKLFEFFFRGQARLALLNRGN